MSYVPVSFSGFGRGLNLRDKVDAVSEEECVDALNVTFTERGAVKQRDGYAALTASTLTNTVASLEPFYTSSGTRQLIAGCGTRLEAIATNGTVTASLTGLTDSTWDFARFGAPGGEYIYAGGGNTVLKRWDGSSWSSIASTPQGGALAVMAVSQGNRLVVGRFNGTAGGPTGGASTSNPSRVYFSDAGAPETWTANNYIDFSPGDGEKVQGIIAWREFVFVFKETKFFVIYGTSLDTAGNPVFQWKAVDAGVGLASPRALCADEKGVYFLDRTGVYMTNGQEPAKLSDLIDPIFLGGSSSFYQGGELLHSEITNASMWTHEKKVYLGFTITGTTNSRTLVYDPIYEWWSLYDLPASCGASFRIGSKAEMVFGAASGSKHIYRHSDAYTADVSTAISSRWRSGWFDYDNSDVKRIRETKVWGSGKVTIGTGADFGEAANTKFLDFGESVFGTWGDGSSASDTWGDGSGPDVWGGGIATTTLEPRIARVAVRGTVFSTKFTNNTLNQGWAVHRLTHHLAGQRTSSTRQVDLAA